MILDNWYLNLFGCYDWMKMENINNIVNSIDECIDNYVSGCVLLLYSFDSGILLYVSYSQVIMLSLFLDV